MTKGIIVCYPRRFPWLKGQKPPKNGKKETFDRFSVILEIRSQRQAILRAKIGRGTLFRMKIDCQISWTSFYVPHFGLNQKKAI